MYRLVLHLPFNVQLMWRYPFASFTEAQSQAERLPGGFMVEPEDHNSGAENILVPFKEKRIPSGDFSEDEAAR